MTRGGRAWRAIHLVVTIASLGFLAWAIAGTGVLADPAWRDPALVGRVALAGCVYAAALLFVVAGWLMLVRSASPERKLALRTGFRIYGLSQLYKYLPSNVLHYVGRHAALRQAGIGHLPAALGGFGEIALLMPAALGVAALAAYLGDVPLDHRIAPTVLAALALGATCALVLAAVSPRLRGDGRTAQVFGTLSSPAVRRAAAGAFACYLLFFVSSSAAFAIVATAGGVWQTSDALLLTAVWAAAWALGFAVPGAPGGLGVREAVMIAGLSPAAGLDGAALVALAMRLATIAGDVVLAAAAYLLGGRSAASDKHREI